MEFIETHLYENCPLERLADEVGLNIHQFSRAFKSSFAMPAHQFLLAQRIERAKTLLRESRQPITAIALELGFSDSSQFSNVFRRRVGVCPRKYRKLVSEIQNGRNFQQNATCRSL